MIVYSGTPTKGIYVDPDQDNGTGNLLLKIQQCVLEPNPAYNAQDPNSDPMILVPNTTVQIGTAVINDDVMINPATAKISHRLASADGLGAYDDPAAVPGFSSLAKATPAMIGMTSLDQPFYRAIGAWHEKFIQVNGFIPALTALLFALLFLCSCTTPERTIMHATYAADGKTTACLSVSHEKGIQLCGLGERHDVAGVRGAASDIGQAPYVALGGMALAAYGISTGNPVAAVSGMATSLVDSYMKTKTAAPAATPLK